MSHKKIFVTARVVVDFAELLPEFDVETYDGELPIPRDFLLKKVESVDGLITMLTDKIDSEVLERAKKLKIVSNYAVGYDNIDVNECTKRGIVVTNTPDVLTDATAEVAWALVFAVARKVVEAHKFVEGKFWRGWSPFMFLGTEIIGKTLGVIGTGRIGQAFALKSKGFDMNVVYYNRSRNELLERELNAKKLDLDTLLEVSDIISVHLPLTSETYHLIGEREFSLMKPNTIFINTARGKIVDEKALIKVLRERKIYGAGLDVFEFEPNVPDELLSLDNVVLLPHIGSATTEARTKMALLVAENIKAFFRGEKPPTLVNKELYGL